MSRNQYPNPNGKTDLQPLIDSINALTHTIREATQTNSYNFNLSTVNSITITFNPTTPTIPIQEPHPESITVEKPIADSVLTPTLQTKVHHSCYRSLHSSQSNLIELPEIPFIPAIDNSIIHNRKIHSQQHPSRSGSFTIHEPSHAIDGVTAALAKPMVEMILSPVYAVACLDLHQMGFAHKFGEQKQQSTFLLPGMRNSNHCLSPKMTSSPGRWKQPPWRRKKQRSRAITAALLQAITDPPKYWFAAPYIWADLGWTLYFQLRFPIPLQWLPPPDPPPPPWLPGVTWRMETPNTFRGSSGTREAVTRSCSVEFVRDLGLVMVLGLFHPGFHSNTLFLIFDLEDKISFGDMGNDRDGPPTQANSNSGPTIAVNRPRMVPKPLNIMGNYVK